MVRYNLGHLIIVALIIPSSLVAQTVDTEVVTNICDCQVEIPCQEREQLRLSLRTRQSYCPRYLDQQLQQLKLNNHLGCSSSTLPERIFAVDVTNSRCEQRALDIVHCKDNRDGQKLCQKLDQSASNLCSELPCLFKLKSLINDIERIHDLVSYLNKPKISASPRDEVLRLDPSPDLRSDPSDELPSLDNTLDPDEPIEVPIAPEPVDPFDNLRKPTDKYMFITQDVGEKASLLAKKICKKIQTITIESKLLKNYYQSLLSGLEFLQQETHMPDLINCAHLLN